MLPIHLSCLSPTALAPSSGPTGGTSRDGKSDSKAAKSASIQTAVVQPPYSEFGEFEDVYDGPYSRVRKTIWRGQTVVFKELKSIDNVAYDERLFQRETGIAASVKHPHVLRQLAACDNASRQAALATSDVLFRCEDLTPSFILPHGSTGTLFIVDAKHHVIREFQPSTGQVRVVAGDFDSSGFANNGQDSRSARFASPRAMCKDPVTPNRLFVSDNSSIRTFGTETRLVTLLAGTKDAGYEVDGSSWVFWRKYAQFHAPGAVWSPDGASLFVCDTENNLVRRINVKTGYALTFSGNEESESKRGIGAITLDRPWSITVDRSTKLSNSALIVGTRSKFVRVEIATAKVSDCKFSLPDGFIPIGIDSLPTGTLIIADRTRVLAVDPVTGHVDVVANDPLANYSALAVDGERGCVYLGQYGCAHRMFLPEPARRDAGIRVASTGAGDSKQSAVEKPRDQYRSMWLLIQFADAINVLHRRGIVHRDIKPSNAFLTADEPPVLKLADFGLSRYVKSDGSRGAITTTHSLAGTLNYMAPEQAEGSATLTPAIDVYAFGGVIYFALFGFEPWTERKREHVHILSALATSKTPPLREDTSMDAKADAKSPILAVRKALLDVMQRCYAFDPVVRPRMDLVLYAIYNLYDYLVWPSANASLALPMLASGTPSKAASKSLQQQQQQQIDVKSPTQQ